MFPHVQSTETRAVDARGWYAGRAAADDAVLGSDRSAVADCARPPHAPLSRATTDLGTWP